MGYFDKFMSTSSLLFNLLISCVISTYLIDEYHKILDKLDSNSGHLDIPSKQKRDTRSAQKHRHIRFQSDTKVNKTHEEDGEVSQLYHNPKYLQSSTPNKKLVIKKSDLVKKTFASSEKHIPEVQVDFHFEKQHLSNSKNKIKKPLKSTSKTPVMSKGDKMDYIKVEVIPD